jgi:hypothetical protein
VAIFLFIVTSIMVMIDCSTRGTRQGNIKHAARLRPIALLFMTNVVCTVFFTLGLLVSLTSNLVNLVVYEPM